MFCPINKKNNYYICLYSHVDMIMANVDAWFIDFKSDCETF